jgi:hypothetical protein
VEIHKDLEALPIDIHLTPEDLGAWAISSNPMALYLGIILAIMGTQVAAEIEEAVDMEEIKTSMSTGILRIVDAFRVGTEAKAITFLEGEATTSRVGGVTT